MQWSLFLLTLMGQCFFYSCRLYKYHLVEDGETWDEAQKYCREKHTDLATVSDMTDTNKLKRMMKKKNVTAAWIGLHSESGKNNRTWHWSLPGVEFNETNWSKGEPTDDGTGNENCVHMKEDDDEWVDSGCEKQHAFVCYDDTDQVDQRFHVEDTSKNWIQAQKHCRTRHTDLISGLDQLKEFNEIFGSQYDEWWIGLFRDTWRWSDGSNSSFRNWASKEFNDGANERECATVTNSSGKWSSENCSETKPFFCYDDKVVLVQQKMNWVDALEYCREKHVTLVAITNAGEQRWAQAKAKNATTSHVWLGLHYTCTLDFWFWVSDKAVDYNNWGLEQEKDGCGMSGAMSREGAHEWVKRPDDEEFNFICSKV